MHIKRSVKFLSYKRSGGNPLNTPIRMRISYAGKNRRFSPQGDTLRNSDITILLAKADKIDTLISKQTLWNY